MKKMAKFLAAVLAVSMLPTFGAFADATYDWNFDDLSESLSTGDYADGSDPHKWYQKGHVALMTCYFNDGESTQQLDADHALSGKLVGSGSFIFTLNYDEASQDNYKRAALVDGETIDLSFDVAVTEVKKASVIFGQNGSWDWDDHLFMADGGKGWNNGKGWGDDNFAKAFDLDDWVRLGFVITRNGDDVNVEKYIDGTFIGEQTVATDKFTSVCVFGSDGAKVYVDNVNVATYTETRAVWTFSEDAVSSKVSEDNWEADGEGIHKWLQAGNVSLWTPGTSGESIATHDSEHGLSAKLMNAGGMVITLNHDEASEDDYKRTPLADGDSIHIGFDIALTEAKQGRVMIGRPDGWAWEDVLFQSVGGRGWDIRDNWGDGDNVCAAEIKANEWVRFDLSLCREGDKVKLDGYVNGAWKDSREFDADKATSIAFGTEGIDSAQTPNKVWLDNITIDSPRHGAKIKAKATAVKADALSSEIIFDHTLERAESKGGSEFYTLNVEEKNLETNATSNFTVDALMDITATKLALDWDPDNDKESMLNYNCQYTISLPIDNSRNPAKNENNTFLKGIESAEKYTGDVVTSTVSFTTPDRDDQYATFEDGKIPASAIMQFFDGDDGQVEDGGPYGKVLHVQSNLNYFPINAPKLGTAEGKYILSFDMKLINETQTLSVYPGASGALLQWDTDGRILSSGKDTNGRYNKNEWHHYDFVFDLTANSTHETEAVVYMDGTKLGTQTIYDIGSFNDNGLWRFQLWTGGKVEFDLDNVHGRYEDANKVTTTIGDTLNVATTSTTIKFEDAVSVESLEDIVIQNANTMKDVDFNLTNVTPYEATINFAANALEADCDYQIKFSKDTSLAEALSTQVIRFKAVETPTVLTISDVAIADLAGTSWDNSKAYDVTITAENTKYPAGKSAFFIIAGYNADGMVNAQAKAVTIGETGANLTLDAMDMTGATSFKCFIMDSLSNLAPLMNAAKVID